MKGVGRKQKQRQNLDTKPAEDQLGLLEARLSEFSYGGRPRLGADLSTGMSKMPRGSRKDVLPWFSMILYLSIC